MVEREEDVTVACWADHFLSAGGLVLLQTPHYPRIWSKALVHAAKRLEVCRLEGLVRPEDVQYNLSTDRWQ